MSMQEMENMLTAAGLSARAQAVSAHQHEIRRALIDCHDALVMQLKFEAGEAINAQSLRLFREYVLERASAVLGK